MPGAPTAWWRATRSAVSRLHLACRTRSRGARRQQGGGPPPGRLSWRVRAASGRSPRIAASTPLPITRAVRARPTANPSPQRPSSLAIRLSSAGQPERRKGVPAGQVLSVGTSTYPPGRRGRDACVGRGRASNRRRWSHACDRGGAELTRDTSGQRSMASRSRPVTPCRAPRSTLGPPRRPSSHSSCRWPTKRRFARCS